MWPDTKKGHNCQLPQLSKHFEQRNLRLTFFCLYEKKNLYFFLIAVDLLTPIHSAVDSGGAVSFNSTEFDKKLFKMKLLLN